jgi:GT2 family glycosyltransferase
MKQIAIVILNWNGRHLLEQFLPALLQHTPQDAADLIVADNGSSDDSLEFLRIHYPSILLLPLDRNYGFAEGYDRALSGMDYEYVVLLNSDVEVTPNWLLPAIEHMKAHPAISALQPKILSYRDKTRFEYAGAAGGFIDRYGYPFCRGRLLNTVEIDRGQYDDPCPILWASGACLFLRLKDFRDAGGFDEAFFAHQEEIDLCWRFNARGKQVICFPDSLVYHVGGATLHVNSPQKDYLNFRNNLLMLYKNLPKSSYRHAMRVRFFLDYLSALHSLLRGRWANAFAIFRARRDFGKMKKSYRDIRYTNLLQSRLAPPATILQESLLLSYYLFGKKKFTDYDTRFEY